jgi:hypothetical protein
MADLSKLLRTMKAMSVFFKILAILGLVSSFLVIEDFEAFLGVILGSIIILSIGVLFKNLGEAFEDIALMRERQKAELIHKEIIKEE